ncbi:MAG: hypothetical protein EXQ56_01395 [Acidobacteria bacterium]|nr:hypothetical protein [Acidobacteriota bacterium]
MRCALLALIFLAVAVHATAQEDFLTREEVDAARDAQEPEKRIPLYLEIADMRLGAMRAALGSAKSSAGRAVQKSLEQYTKILEAIETTMADARERRAPFPKAMELLKTRLPESRQFLESLDNDASPIYANYQFTLEESIAVTEELLEDVAKGMFPEVDERTAPTEFPAAPPRPDNPRERPRPAAGKDGEEGPPRKRPAPPASTSGAAPAPSPEEGPPRKSDRQ